MINGFNESEKSEKLEKRISKDGEIFIKYLDGSISGPIPNTPWNINNIDDRLMKQAIERDQSKEIVFTERSVEQVVDKVYKYMLTVGMLTSAVTTIISPVIAGKIFFAMLLLIFACILLIHIKNHKEYISSNQATWDELEKYDIFLTLQTEFEDYGITINDLDSYSLDEIKQIENDMNEKAKVKKLV